MTDIKQQLDQYTLDLKKLVNIKPKSFEIAQVANMVTSIPERKWNAAQAVVLATLAHKDAKNTLSSLKASKMLQANQNKDKYGSAEDRKAYAETHPEVIQAGTDLLNAEAEKLSATLAYECLDDLFTAGKKIMDYLSEQDKAEKQYQKYSSEGQK